MLLKLTDIDNIKLLINMNNVMAIYRVDDDGCAIDLINSETWYVKESIEEIEHLIRDFDNA